MVAINLMLKRSLLESTWSAIMCTNKYKFQLISDPIKTKKKKKTKRKKKQSRI